MSATGTTETMNPGKYILLITDYKNPVLKPWTYDDGLDSAPAPREWHKLDVAPPPPEVLELPELLLPALHPLLLLNEVPPQPGVVLLRVKTGVKSDEQYLLNYRICQKSHASEGCKHFSEYLLWVSQVPVSKKFYIITHDSLNYVHSFLSRAAKDICAMRAAIFSKILLPASR